MAAATAVFSIDPSKGAKYPITVSERLLKSSTGRKRNHASVQLNHKPKVPRARTTLTSERPESGAYKLTVKDEEDDRLYTYTGSQAPVDSCVLFYDTTTQQMVLDRIDTSFAFNLQSTPTSNDAQSLAKQYPHLETEQVGRSVNDNVTSSVEQENEDVGDPDNPYDYRHFLREAIRHRTSSPEPRSNFGSPPAQRPSAVPSPVPRPSRAVSKPKQRARPQQKRPKSPLPREEADADNEDSDGDLIIEMEPDTKRRNRFMGAFDRDITSNGPISLRSAASSMSPAARNARDSSVESSRNRDADVEELKLPSPRRSPPAQTPQEEAEDEADLEAELEMALEESQDDQEEGVVGLGISEGVNGVMHDESSSESEEE